jgi:hypothetical protein
VIGCCVLCAVCCVLGAVHWVQGAGCRVQSAGCESGGFRVQGAGCGVRGVKMQGCEIASVCVMGLGGCDGKRRDEKVLGKMKGLRRAEKG